MKPITHLALAAALGLTLCSDALAQNRVPRGDRPPQGQPPADAPRRMDSSIPVQHMTAAYARIAPFDVNKDGQLGEDEQDAITQAVAAGTLELPARPGGPRGAGPNAEQVAHRLAGMYASIAPFDANQDNVLDETEQAAVKSAIESGELKRPFGPGMGRPPGAGRHGGRHGRPDAAAETN